MTKIARGMIDPDDAVMLLIDHQSGLFQLVKDMDMLTLRHNVIALANPQLTGTLNFGAVAVNSGAVQRSIAVSNVLNAPNASFQELLNATFGTLTNTGVGSYGTSGSVAGLAAGAPANTNMVVTFTPGGTAGAISGNVQIQLASDGTSFGLGTTTLAAQPVTFTGSVTGLVFNQAQGQATPTTVAFGNVRINTAQTQNVTVSNIAPAGAFTEGLNANFGLNTGAATNNGGTIASLPGGAPGNPAASNSTSMSVGLDTTAAGARASRRRRTSRARLPTLPARPGRFPPQTVPAGSRRNCAVGECPGG